MDAPPTIDLGLAEDVYCEARARRYIGAKRVREVCDTELELWLRAERAAAREELQTRLACVRALLLHLQGDLESLVSKLEKITDRPTLAINAADVPELVAKATTVHALWRDYASQEMYGEFLHDGLDPMDLDLLESAMGELADALKPFEQS
jgi:hypothetical protein